MLLLSRCSVLLAVTVAVAVDAADKLPTPVKVPPGWNVTLYAAPPNVGYPTCLSTSPNGDLFVGIDENGSLDTKPQRGRVVRCTDTNHDGVADKFVTFAEMDSPRGIWFEANTLYVMHPPLVSAFKDTDGDGKADTNEVLVRGLGFDLKFRGADHTVNGMRMGIDGFLYIAVGDYGATNAVAKDGSAIQLHGGGVVRVRPDGSSLEVVSRGQRNIYDVATSPEMDLFTRDNTNDGDGWDVRLSHVIMGGEYGYPSLYKKFSDEIVQPLADYGGGSPCGALFMDEPGFPDGLGRGLYTVEWGRGGVFRHPLTPNGASFKAGQEKFIDVSRPTDFDVDGSGRLYVASWHGAAFNYNGPQAGFVAQVTPPGWKYQPFADLQKLSDAPLLEQLGSGSAFARLYAQREILRRKGQDALRAGLERLATTASSSSIRAAAIFTLGQWGAEAQKSLVELSRRDELREFALRAISDNVREKTALPAAPFVAALTDTNARVRLQAVTALGRLGPKQAAASMLPLVADTDAMVSHAAVHALVQLRASEVAFTAFDSAGSSAWQPGAARVLQALHEPAVVEQLIARVKNAKDVRVRQTLLGALARLYNREARWDGKWWGTRPDTTGPYFKPVTWESSPAIAAVLKEELERAEGDALKWLVVTLQKSRVDVPELTPTVLKLAAADPQFRTLAVELFSSRSSIPEEAIPLFASVVTSSNQPPSLRLRAMRALGKAAKNPAAAEAALAGAVAITGEKSQGDLNSAWEDFARDSRHSQNVARFQKLAEEGTPSERIVSYAVLVSLSSGRLSSREARAAASASVDRAWQRPENAVPLLRAIGRLRSDPYALQVRGLMNDSRPEIAAAAKQAASQLRLETKKDANEPLLESFGYEQVLASVAQAKGEVRRGREVFNKAGCAACHTVSTDEPPKGPFLGGIATRYSRAELCESILKPSAKIAQGFETQWFETNDDEEYEGFVTREGGDDLDVRNIAGITTTLAKKNITERGHREISMMPPGLMDKLTMSDLAALLAYLESLKSN